VPARPVPKLAPRSRRVAPTACLRHEASDGGGKPHFKAANAARAETGSLDQLGSAQRAAKAAEPPPGV
jgi:hypothetical protein